MFTRHLPPHSPLALLAGLLLSLTILTAFSQRSSRLVESVDVQGNRRLSDVEILSHVKTRPGEPFDHKQVMRDLQTLVDLRLFDRAGTRVVEEEGRRGGVAVIFEVKELPIIEALKFEGLNGVSEDELLKELRKRGLEVAVGAVYEQDTISKAMAAIKEALTARGWRGVGVETRLDQVYATSVRLTFVISGQPAKKKPGKPVKPDEIARLTPSV